MSSSNSKDNFWFRQQPEEKAVWIGPKIFPDWIKPGMLVEIKSSKWLDATILNNDSREDFGLNVKEFSCLIVAKTNQTIDFIYNEKVLRLFYDRAIEISPLLPGSVPHNI